ncbi:MAG: transglycosylase domain-containing protein, partial [Bdellovibrionales bacterium]|nr:transglycosylase domain-containing protein [Bdellovibrionales bacterium]
MGTFKKLFILISFTSVVGAFVGLGTYYYFASTLPELFSVEDYDPLLVSEVYARNGEKIGEFYRENRKLVPVDEIPENLINAFLAAEDSDFYDHSGLNYKGLVRAALKNFTTGKKAQGASTITMQTARTLFFSSEKTYIRKIREIIMARRMERHLSKDEILYLYLNQIYFGQGAHGVASAAEIFFRKKVKDLTLAEMAVLAGSLTAPSAYNIVSNPKRAKIRQQYVLK